MSADMIDVPFIPCEEHGLNIVMAPETVNANVPKAEKAIILSPAMLLQPSNGKRRVVVVDQLPGLDSSCIEDGG